MTRTALFALLCASLHSPAPAAASDGGYRLAVGNKAMSCVSRDGRPVRFISNPALADLGSAYIDANGVPTIAINPRLLREQPEKVATWAIEHECSHHWLPASLNTEARADCLAMRRTVRQTGRLSDTDRAAFRRTIAYSSTKGGHLAGDARFRMLLRCADVQQDGLFMPPRPK
jgi:hypothetical protein